MDFKSLISKIESIDGRVETPKAPELPKTVQLNEDAQLRVLAGTSTYVSEAKKKADEDKKEEKVKEGQEDLKKVGDKVKTSKGVMTKTATGLKHERSYTKDKDEDDEDTPKAKKVKKESVDPEKFKSKFSKMVEAKKDKKDIEKKSKVDLAALRTADKEAKEKQKKKVEEGSKPDFLDMDKDGDKKEPMKKAVADKGGDKKDGKKGMSAAQEKYFGKKNESKMMPKGKKRPVKESVEQTLTFKDMVRLVQESGGQQQIDPVDKALFTWASRVATNKLGEGMKAELYAGLIYERNGGTFEMYDVLSESKKNLDESVLTEGMLGKLKDFVISKIMPKLSDEDKDNIQSAVQKALGKTEVSMADITPANIKAVGKAMGAKPQEESMSMEADDPFYHKNATTAEKITSMVGIVGGIASMIAAFTTGPAWLMIPGLIGLMFMSQVGTAKKGSF